MQSRPRDLGIQLGVLPPGPLNAITDVAGVRVGHTTLWQGEGALVRGQGPVRTGVTAILPPGDDPFAMKMVAAAHVFNGFGKTIGLVQVAELGQLETPILLTNTLSVGQVADAVVDWMIQRHPAIGVTTGTVNPVVAECNDGYLNDIGGRHVTAAATHAALDNATAGPVAEGNLGAGTGMTCYSWAGGIGTASRRLVDPATPWTVGTLVLANFGRANDLLIAGVPIETQRHAGSESRDAGSIIVVLATDAPLDARQLARLTHRVPLGLARTGSHGGHGSGDIAIAFSTANQIPHETATVTRTITVVNDDHPVLDELFRAVVETTEEAIVNALWAARPIVGRDGHQRAALPHEAVLTLLRQHGVIHEH